MGGGVQGSGFGSRGKISVQGVRSPGGRFTGVEGSQMRGRGSGVGERVGGIASDWRWKRGSVQVTRGPGGEAPWLARCSKPCS